MERSKFTIYSKTPCLVFCDKAFVGEVDEKTCAKLEMFDNESKRIEIYPKSTKDLIYFIPFSIVISQQDNFSPNYQQFDLLDGNYEIMLNPRLELHFPMSFDKIFEEEKKGTRICVLSSSLTKITLENYGATRQALTKSAIEDFSIPVPTPEEQERIVKNGLNGRTNWKKRSTPPLPTPKS